MNEMWKNWKKSSSELVKIQGTYAFVAVASLLLAGLIGLLDTSLSDRLLQVTMVAAVVFAINFVVWSAISSFVTVAPRATTATARKSKK